MIPLYVSMCYIKKLKSSSFPSQKAQSPVSFLERKRGFSLDYNFLPLLLLMPIAVAFL